MNESIAEFTSDEDAARFVETADLSQHDLACFQPTRFEFQRLRQAWAEGVESGDAGHAHFNDLKSEARRLAARIQTGLCQANRDEFATEEEVATAFTLLRHDQEIADQREALIEGEESGISPRTLPDILAEVMAEQQGGRE